MQYSDDCLGVVGRSVNEPDSRRVKPIDDATPTYCQPTNQSLLPASSKGSPRFNPSQLCIGNGIYHLMLSKTFEALQRSTHLYVYMSSFLDVSQASDPLTAILSTAAVKSIT